MNNILKEFNNRKNLNILCTINHERYQTYLSYVPDTHYYMWDSSDLRRKWHNEFAPIPSNYTLIKDLTPDIIDEIDIILSQNKFGDWQLLSQVANNHQIPMIQLEHTTPDSSFTEGKLSYLHKMQGHKNIFITDYSANEWGFYENYQTVNHMIDCDMFDMKFSQQKEKTVLSVCNDLKDRDYVCGYSIWEKIAREINCRLVGTCNHGIGKPAKSTKDLVETYQNHLIFLNTSTFSPLPCAVLEAMSCGLVVVSTATCEIPNVINHCDNGFLYHPDKPEDAIEIINMLLSSKPEKLVEIGQRARRTVEEKFSKKQFVKNWNNIYNDFKC